MSAKTARPLTISLLNPHSSECGLCARKTKREASNRLLTGKKIENI